MVTQQFTGISSTGEQKHSLAHSNVMETSAQCSINPLPSKVNSSFFPNRQINTLCLCTIYHLIATDHLIKELTSAAIILRGIALKCQKLATSKMYQTFTILGIPLTYSLFSSAQCIALCAFHLHPKKRTKNLWGCPTMYLIWGVTIL